MVKKIAILLLFVAQASLADVNTDIQNCLNSNSTEAGSKTTCVQTAMNAEEQNQIKTLFSLYKNFVTNELNPTGGGGGGPVTNTTPLLTQPKASTPNPATAPPPSPTSQPAKTTPNQGGIQYY